MPDYTKSDIETRKAIMTPEELKEFGEEPNLEDIEARLKETKAGIAKLGAGIRSLAEIDTTKAPALDTNADDIRAADVGVLAGAEGDMTQFQGALAEAMGVEIPAKTDTAQKGILDWVKGITQKRAEVREAQPTTQEITTQVMEQFGITPESLQRRQGLIGQLTEFSRQQADLEAQKQQRLLGAEQQFAGRLTSALRGEQSLIERQYNSKIAAKAAQAAVIGQQLQLERGLFQDAMAMTSMVVQAATYDQQQQIADLDWAFDTYKDLYAIMDADERKEWDRSYTLAKDELDRQQSDATNKMNLLTSAAQAGINLGWDMNYMQSKSLEELTSEYSTKVSAQVRAEKAQQDAEELGQYGLTKAEEGRFWKAITIGREELMSDIPWGPTWDKIKGQFPKVPDTIIDKYLGTEWKERGAYATFAAGGYPTVPTAPGAPTGVTPYPTPAPGTPAAGAGAVWGPGGELLTAGQPPVGPALVITGAEGSMFDALFGGASEEEFPWLFQ